MRFPSIICTGVLGASAILLASNAFADPPHMCLGHLSASSVKSCVRVAEDALREAEFHRVELSDNGKAVFGQRGDYKAAVYCGAEIKAFFSVAGPETAVSCKYVDAIKNGF